MMSCAVESAWNFIVACNISECYLVRDAVNCGVLFGRRNSIMGRNAWSVCSLHYKRSMNDMLTERLSSEKLFKEYFSSTGTMSDETARRV